MQTTNLAVRVNRRIDELMELTNVVLGIKRIRRPVVDYELRGFAAGMAFGVGCRISLNPVLLYENQDQFIQESVGHEFTHLLTFAEYGIVTFAHGRQWQGFMRALNVPIKIDHTYDVSTILGSRKTITYTPSADDEVMWAYQHAAASVVIDA